MPRGKDAPTQVGGEISPYVQTSLQRGKQQAGSRLVAAMQEAGATSRTVTAEQGATERAGMQAETQRAGMAAQAESDDKRAAEDERARRDDRKFAQTMSEASQEFQAKQAELNRNQQNAIIAGDRKAKDEIEKRRESLRRFNIELNMDAAERNTNAMLSIIKGSLKRETMVEKAKTTLEEDATRFDQEKDIYIKAKERTVDIVEFDKRMDLPVLAGIKEKIPSKWDIAKGMITKGPVFGALAEVQRYRGLRKEVKEGIANPMAVLQEQIDEHGGNISIENLTPENINKTEEQIQKGDVKTTDINGTLGALEGMLDAVNIRRKGVAKDSGEFDFWQDTYLNISQMRDDLEGLAKSTDKKIIGSETETVGSRVQYALGTVYDSSLGGQAARMRDLVGGDFTAVFEEMTKSVQIPKLYDITPDMNKYDVEYRTWFNNYLGSRYPEEKAKSSYEVDYDYYAPERKFGGLE